MKQVVGGVGGGVFGMVLLMSSVAVTAEDKFACSKIENELEVVNVFDLTSQARLAAMTGLFSNLKDLLVELLQENSTHPKAFLQTCLRSKQALFDRHHQRSDPQSRQTLEYQLMVGEYHYLAQRFSLAADHFEAAVRISPEDYRPFWWRLRNFVELAKQNPSEFGFDRSARETERYLLEVANHGSVPKDLRVEALRELGVLKLKMKDFEEASHYYRRLLQADPQSEDAVAFLVQYHYDRLEKKQALELVLQKLNILKAKSLENRRILEIGRELSEGVLIQRELIDKHYARLFE